MILYCIINNNNYYLLMISVMIYLRIKVVFKNTFGVFNSDLFGVSYLISLYEYYKYIIYSVVD